MNSLVAEWKNDWDSSTLAGKVMLVLFALLFGAGLCSLLALIVWTFLLTVEEATTTSPYEFVDQYAQANRPALTRMLADELEASGELPEGVPRADLEHRLDFGTEWDRSGRGGGRGGDPQLYVIPIYSSTRVSLGEGAYWLTAEGEFTMYILDEKPEPRLLSIKPTGEPFIHTE